MRSVKSRTNWDRVRESREEAPIPWDSEEGPYNPNDSAAAKAWLSQAVVRRPGERGPGKAPKKKLVSLRLSAEVLEHFRASGPGWQTRIDETLKRSIGTRRRKPVSQ
jgi:uncharacterized protein (DUF4415 family)